MNVSESKCLFGMKVLEWNYTIFSLTFNCFYPFKKLESTSRSESYITLFPLHLLSSLFKIREQDVKFMTEYITNNKMTGVVDCGSTWQRVGMHDDGPLVKQGWTNNANTRARLENLPTILPGTWLLHIHCFFNQQWFLSILYN